MDRFSHVLHLRRPAAPARDPVPGPDGPIKSPLLPALTTAIALGLVSGCGPIATSQQSSVATPVSNDSRSSLTASAFTSPWNGFFCKPPRTRIALDTATRGFTLNNAYWTAWAALQAYGGEAQKRERLRAVGLERIRFFDDRASSLQGFVASDGEKTIVAFGGTNDLKDAITDLSFDPTTQPVPGIPGRVHRGFARALENTWNELEATILEFSSHGERPVFVTGHSLGAALATLTASRLWERGVVVEGAYLFSSPRVGNIDFAREMGRRLGTRTFRFVNHEDIIPRLPPSRASVPAFAGIFNGSLSDYLLSFFDAADYHHVGALYTYDARGTLGDPTVEDPAADSDYWSSLKDAVGARDPLDFIMGNWRVVGDHMPMTTFCHIARAIEAARAVP